MAEAVRIEPGAAEIEVEIVFEAVGRSYIDWGCPVRRMNT